MKLFKTAAPLKGGPLWQHAAVDPWRRLVSAPTAALYHLTEPLLLSPHREEVMMMMKVTCGDLLSTGG